MTIAKVTAGQPLKISAESFNAFVDVATAYQASRQSRAADGGMVTAIPGIILLRNDSGTDQGRFAVLGLDEPLILPSENPQAFQERITFSGVSPDEAVHANRFCILQEPIAAGGVGRAMVAGVTPMRLDIDAEEDELAAIITDETGSLATGGDGGARILWKEPGTGAAWGIVQLPAGGAAGGSPNLVLTVTVTNHGWLVGDVLRWAGATWALADAGVVGGTDILGVVGRIPDEDTALLVLWGICCLDGLTPHTDYWLDPSVPGGLTPTKPDENGRLVLHHAQDRLCVVRAGSAGAGGGAERFADLTDVDVITTPPADEQAPVWDAAAERWKPHYVILADPVPAHQVLAGPVSGPDAKPDFRDVEVGDLQEVTSTTVLANATGATARPTAFAATTDDRALLRVGGTLQWLQIPTGTLADAAITTSKVADGAISDAKIATVSWGKLTGVPTTFPMAAHDHPLGGDLTGTTTDAQIAAEAVGTTELAANAVTGAKIADGTVTNAKLAKDYLTIAGVNYHLGDPVTNVLANPMTTSGDLIVGGTAGAPTRLPVNPGGTLQVLTSKSGQTQLLAHTLDLLEDVTISAPHTGQVLTYDTATSRWRNADASGGSGGGPIDGLSVLGNPDSTTQVVTPIIADADNQVLLRISGSLGWGSVPLAALDEISGPCLLGMPINAVGTPQVISANPDFSVLGRVGTTLAFRTVLPRISFGGAVGGFTKWLNASGVVSHEYDPTPTAQAFKQYSNGRMRFYTSPTAFWQIATNGGTVEIAGFNGTAYTHRLSLDATVVLGGAARTLSLREIDVCENGVAKKMAILASATY